MLPAIQRALAKEQDPEIKALLTLTQATVQLASSDKPTRIGAIRALAESRDPNTKTLLLPLLEKKGGEFAEPDSDVRAEAELSLRAIESRLATGEMVGRVFSGVSLGSILLLAALGLAITYGLMGVINMAHGELIMIGAYATYVVQNLFRSHLPGAFDLYLRRGGAGGVRRVGAGRHGARAQRDPLPLRPAARDAARDLGHQPDPDPGDAHALRRAERAGRESGVDVGRRPALLEPGAAVQPHRHHRLRGGGGRADRAAADAHAARPLRARRHAEPLDGELRSACRPDASTPTRSAWAPASPGSPAARCRRSATSARISARATSSTRSWSSCWAASGSSPGTVYAAMGLGIANKFLEAWSGAVLAKIAMLVFIIVFIQKRPQGLFALKGRMADA